jgi:hypothetical protein
MHAIAADVKKRRQSCAHNRAAFFFRSAYSTKLPYQHCLIFDNMKNITYTCTLKNYNGKNPHYPSSSKVVSFVELHGFPLSYQASSLELPVKSYC